MGWGSLRNIASVAAAPFTGGASLLAAEIPGKGSVIGELTGQNSAQRANEQNIKNQNYWNNKNIELANTAHQREMADLKAAGLNPVLAANSGAATPALESPTVENTMPGGYMNQLTQGIGILQGLASIKNIATNSALQGAQTAATAAQTAQTQLNTAITRKMGPSTIQQAEQNVKNAIETQKLIQNQTAQSAAQTAKTQQGAIADITGTSTGDKITKGWNYFINKFINN